MGAFTKVIQPQQGYVPGVVQVDATLASRELSKGFKAFGEAYQKAYDRARQEELLKQERRRKAEEKYYKDTDFKKTYSSGRKKINDRLNAEVAKYMEKRAEIGSKYGYNVPPEVKTELSLMRNELIDDFAIAEQTDKEFTDAFANLEDPSKGFDAGFTAEAYDNWVNKGEVPYKYLDFREVDSTNFWRQNTGKKDLKTITEYEGTGKDRKSVTYEELSDPEASKATVFGKIMENPGLYKNIINKWNNLNTSEEGLVAKQAIIQRAADARITNEDVNRDGTINQEDNAIVLFAQDDYVNSIQRRELKRVDDPEVIKEPKSKKRTAEEKKSSYSIQSFTSIGKQGQKVQDDFVVFGEGDKINNIKANAQLLTVDRLVDEKSVREEIATKREEGKEQDAVRMEQALDNILKNQDGIENISLDKLGITQTVYATPNKLGKDGIIEFNVKLPKTRKDYEAAFGGALADDFVSLAELLPESKRVFKVTGDYYDMEDQINNVYKGIGDYINKNKFLGQEEIDLGF